MMTLMLNLTAEKSLARLLMFGGAFITILVWTTVTDPVNVTKLLALGGVAGAAIAVSASFGAKDLWKSYKLPISLLALFLLTVLNSVFQSEAPSSQLLYGAYGRNTGLVTYVLLIFLFISAMSLSQKDSFLKISYGVLIAGALNVIYSLWVILFGDFIGWNNPYGNILGTFGNPNFVGSFLGIFASVLFACIVKPNVKLINRVALTLVLLATFVEIQSSNAIQGIVVAGGGISLVGFYFLRSKFKSNVITVFYSAAVFIVGIFALMGALQKGPLTGLIYKNSVSLRGEYWQAGWNMGNKFPFSGVGMDTYGDWYRQLRDDQALINPGPNTVTNAAHNVILDQFAYGGWPMLLAYLAIFPLVILAIFRVSFRNREFDFTFISLAVAWICYQVQSVISINQIGLAIWGWILGGALIAYEKVTRTSQRSETKSSTPNGRRVKNKESLGISPLMTGTLGAVVGLLIAVPPFSSDLAWNSALKSGDLNKIEKALQTSYLSPQNSYRYITLFQILEQNQLFDLSHKYSKIATDFNPHSFDAWLMLHYSQKATPAEKATAKENLLKLDPLNPNIFTANE
jgi:hypothetical protein